jgi:hypothetical protein
MYFKHLQHVQHPPICNIIIEQLQYISETSKTTEAYICNIEEGKDRSRQRAITREHHLHLHRAWLGRAGAPAPAAHSVHTTATSATSTRLGSARWAARVMGGASTTSTSASGEKRWRGCE